MHVILLYLSYAFSIWMMVDAYKRGASHFWYLIIFIPFGEWVYFFLVKAQDFKFSKLFSRPGSDLKCANCKYCGALYEDRVQCRFGREPIVKTRIHISYCDDYIPR